MSMAPSQPRFEPARIIIVMGVSSSGKSTIGAALGKAIGAPFLDGDGYHPAANVEKMRSGVPLTDEDRWPWLKRLAEALHAAAEESGTVVSACSALKRSYRDYLTEMAGEPILFVYLKGSIEVVRKRIEKRHHEYMPASLLDSQFATLEEPGSDENVLIEPISDDPVAVDVAEILSALSVNAQR